MIKLGLDGGPLKSGDTIRGIGVYVRELSSKLNNVEVIDTSTADLSKFDLVHFTRFNPFRLSIPYKKPEKTKFVLTVYDLIPLIYPGQYHPGIKGALKWDLNKYLIRKNIDAIITISETSKKDICRFLEVDPRKVYVTHLAASSVFKKMENGKWKMETKENYGLPERFALYVGDVNYNKNIPALIKACEDVHMPLVVAGKQAIDTDNLIKNIPHGPRDILRSILGVPHPQLRHLREVVNLFNKAKVIRLGFVPDNELVKIYNLASVYVQASFYEGFSLPPLQAVASQTPLAISKNQCHVEVFGAEFEYFDPNSVGAISKAIMHPNINKRLPRRYDWKKTAQKTAEIYEQIRI